MFSYHLSSSNIICITGRECFSISECFELYIPIFSQIILFKLYMHILSFPFYIFFKLLQIIELVYFT